MFSGRGTLCNLLFGQWCSLFRDMGRFASCITRYNIRACNTTRYNIQTCNTTRFASFTCCSTVLIFNVSSTGLSRSSDFFYLAERPTFQEDKFQITFGYNVLVFILCTIRHSTPTIFGVVYEYVFVKHSR